MILLLSVLLETSGYMENTALDLYELLELQCHHWKIVCHQYAMDLTNLERGQLSSPMSQRVPAGAKLTGRLSSALESKGDFLDALEPP